MSYEVYRTEEFIEWFATLIDREQGRLNTRIANIEDYAHFGDYKHLASALFELRWKNGTRIYFAKIENKIILLYGGRKNEQKKDIKKAKILLGRYA